MRGSCDAGMDITLLLNKTTTDSYKTEKMLYEEHINQE